MHLVKWEPWDKISKAKRFGGQEFKKLHIQNAALLAKWRWRFGHGKNSHWVKVVCKNYDKNSLWVYSPSIKDYGYWVET